LSKPLKKLLQHPGVWRVDGYNNLRLYANSAPRVFVSLSRIEEKGLDAALYNEQTTDDKLWTMQPLSRISDLLIGSCWRGGEDGGGKRINRPAAMKKKFLVDTSKVQIVELGQPVTLNGATYDSVLPSGAIKLSDEQSKRMRRSLYAVVPVLQDYYTEFLVVSCYELYRAYVGVSDRFMNSLVHGDLSRYFKWKDPKLKVNKRLNKLEQFVAYRGHYSQEGRDWFNMPSNHLKAIAVPNQTSSAERQEPLILKSTFPFKGLTKLTVAGKKFQNTCGEQSVWCVFAANLLHCNKSVDFDEVLVESDHFSINPLPWGNDTGGTSSDDDDPFDDEDTPGTEDPPNTAGPRIALLDPSNFFGAMQQIRFKHTATGESKDPVYENDLGEPVDTSSGEELEPKSENDPYISPLNRFDSHVDIVDRKLSDFIKTIILLRELVAKRKWVVRTRCRGSSVITVENEIVTTFLDTRKPRRRWHRIGEGNDARLRQIAWVEIAISDSEFIYLMEMELNNSAKGRSTLCVVAKDRGYMDEADFRIFLSMTAAKNMWPRAHDNWEKLKAEAKETAIKYFDIYKHTSINHPWTHYTENGEKKAIDEDVLRTKWASDLETHLVNILGLER